MKKLNNVLSFAVAVTLATAVNVRADQTASPILGNLSGTTAIELPAKAAQMVSEADAKNIKQTTIDVVKAAVGLNPAAAATIVGSIAQKAPEMAATAAATAITLVPDQAVTIARAAAAAAPAQAGQIVEAMCRVLPAAFQKVAEAVADVVPSANKEILKAVATAIPTLKMPISQVLAGNNGNISSVSSVLEQAGQISASGQLAALTQTLPQSAAGSPALADPTFGPPFTPPTTPHNNINPGSGGVVPTGGRNYAAP